MSLDAHRFYHKNFPTGWKLRNNFPRDMELTFLKGTEFPTIVHTSNQSIIIPKGLGNYFNQKFVKKVSKRGLKIYLYEPLCCYIQGKPYNRFFYSEFSIHDDLTLIRSEELDSIQKLIDNYGFYNVTVYTGDYNVEKYLGQHYSFNVKCKDLFLSDIKNSVLRINAPKKIQKHFWCAIGRYTYPRHLIISYLANFPGTYTWHYKFKSNVLAYSTWLEKEKLSKEICSMIETGNKILNDNYFNIDIELSSREEITSPAEVYIPNVHDIRSNKFHESYDNCFVSIVAETRYAQPTANVSEKLLVCISSLTPFIMLAPPHTLEYIKSLGFKTFSNFWSEKYDTIEDPTERLKEIFSLIDQIGLMSLSQLEQMHVEMSEVLQFNLDILNNLNHK
jgi:hypothetical protein